MNIITQWQCLSTDYWEDGILESDSPPNIGINPVMAIKTYI
jgi:hypothetical protein